MNNPLGSNGGEPRQLHGKGSPVSTGLKSLHQFPSLQFPHYSIE